MSNSSVLPFLVRALLAAAFAAGAVATAGAQSIVAYCFGTASACPCGNAGGPGEGCLNSFGHGAILSAVGTASVAADTLRFDVDSLPTSTSIVYFQGTQPVNAGSGTPLGDGLLCAGGTLIRIGVKTSSGGSSSFGFGVNGDPLISDAGLLPAIGGRRYYQGWYRNTAAFCTPDGYNLSNGLIVDWSP